MYFLTNYATVGMKEYMNFFFYFVFLIIQLVLKCNKSFCFLFVSEDKSKKII